jgi:hypothetical protein
MTDAWRHSLQEIYLKKPTLFSVVFFSSHQSHPRHNPLSAEQSRNVNLSYLSISLSSRHVRVAGKACLYWLTEEKGMR